MTLPAWDETERTLRAAGASAGPAECHGLLCGLIAAGATEPRAVWLAELTGDDAPGEALEELHRATLRQLDDPEFGLELLLPADDMADLDDRTRALAEWAGGLTFGVACANRHPDDLPADAAEFLRDAAQIAALTPGDEGDGDEADYAEIVEYLRAGTLLTRTLIQAEGAGNRAAASPPGADEHPL